MPRTKKAAADAAVENAEVKEEAKTAKKTTARKPKVKEPKVNVVVEVFGKNVAVSDLVEAVKEAYKANGNTEDIETIDVYYQPENNKVYYVVNGKSQDEPVNV